MEKPGETETEGIRLPELAVFKRYSLALRQEYAPADEVRSILERAISQIEKAVAKAEDTRRRAEESSEIVEQYIEDEELDDERPFWEVEEEAPPKVKAKRSTKKAVAKKKPVARAKPAAKSNKKKAKKRSAATGVVRVSERGKPIKR